MSALEPIALLMAEDIEPGLPPSPPREVDERPTDEDLTTEEREAQGSSLPLTPPTKEPEGNSVEAPTIHPRAGYGRLPRIEIVDDTVRRSARRLGVVVLVLIALVIIVSVLSVLGTFFVTQTASLQTNEKLPELVQETLLPDGEYIMTPKTFLVGDGKCYFAGPVAPARAEGDKSKIPSEGIAIQGNTLAECGVDTGGAQREQSPPAARVIFVVSQNKSAILRLEAEQPTASNLAEEDQP